MNSQDSLKEKEDLNSQILPEETTQVNEPAAETNPETLQDSVRETEPEPIQAQEQAAEIVTEPVEEAGPEVAPEPDPIQIPTAEVVSESVEEIIMKLLKRNPEDRYQNVREVKKDLEKALKSRNKFYVSILAQA